MAMFEDIKVGDKVYLEEKVVIGFNRFKTFSIPYIVKRVTKTQFVTEKDRRFDKKYGREIRDRYSRANLDGKDETNEMNQFKFKLKLISRLNNILSSLRMSKESDLEPVEIQQMIRWAMKIQSKL